MAMNHYLFGGWKKVITDNNIPLYRHPRNPSMPTISYLHGEWCGATGDFIYALLFTENPIGLEWNIETESFKVPDGLEDVDMTNVADYRESIFVEVTSDNEFVVVGKYLIDFPNTLSHNDIQRVVNSGVSVSGERVAGVLVFSPDGKICHICHEDDSTSDSDEESSVSASDQSVYKFQPVSSQPIITSSFWNLFVTPVLELFNWW